MGLLMDDLILDKRIVRRNLDNSKISSTDYDNYLSKLPDLTEQCTDIMDSVLGIENQEDANQENIINEGE